MTPEEIKDRLLELESDARLVEGRYGITGYSEAVSMCKSLLEERDSLEKIGFGNGFKSAINAAVMRVDFKLDEYGRPSCFVKPEIAEAVNDNLKYVRCSIRALLPSTQTKEEG